MPMPLAMVKATAAYPLTGLVTMRFHNLRAVNVHR